MKLGKKKSTVIRGESKGERPRMTARERGKIELLPMIMHATQSDGERTRE